MIVNDLEAAKLLKSSHFQHEKEDVVKRRVRAFMRKNKIKPAETTEQYNLYRVADILKFRECSIQSKKRTRPITTPTAISGASASDEARKLLA